MNKQIFIAAHHYQNADIVDKADLVADSYRLAVEAAKSDAQYIVVCGVRFMAESIATLARPGQKVIHPNPLAGCPMADMVTLESAERALALIHTLTGKKAVPVTYMNSNNSVKALTGREDGSICTSGNAKKILSHYIAGENPVLFMPDKNLGMNTARTLGIPDSQIAVISRDGSHLLASDGSHLLASANSETRLFLWDGWCPIHQAFTVSDIEDARKKHPGITITVHPECPPDVAAKADLTGSTEGIYNQLKNAADGSVWGVGTEIHFVERMAQLFPAKKIFPIRLSSCINMILITPASLDASLRAIDAHEKIGAPLDIVTIAPEEKEAASRALNTMVRLTDA